MKKSELDLIKEEILALPEKKALAELKRRRRLSKNDASFIGSSLGLELESDIAIKGLKKAKSRKS